MRRVLPSRIVKAMRNITTLALLFLASTSFACTVKPGYLAGGLMRQPASLAPECGKTRDTLRRAMNMFVEASGLRVAWQEVYSGNLGNAKAVMDYVGVNMAKSSYQYFDQDRMQNGHVHVVHYANPTANTLLSVFYMSINGRLLVGFVKVQGQ